MRLNFIKILNLVTILFCLLILTVIENIPNEFSWIVFLPIVYLILINVKSIKQIISRYFTLKMFFFLAFIKYVFLTFLIIATSNYDAMAGNSTSDIPEAIFLMTYELVIIGIFLSIFNRKKIFNTYQNKPIKLKDFQHLTLKFSILIGLFGFAFYDEFLQGIIWFKDSESMLNNLNYVPIDGWFMGLIFYFSKFVPVFIFLIILRNLSNRPKQKRTFLLWFFTFIFGLVNILLVFTENRGIIVSTGITTIIIFQLLFPQFKKRIISFFGLLILFSVIVSTVFRMFNTNQIITSSGDLYEFFVNEEPVITLDAYLSGPSSVSSGLKTYRIFRDKITYKTLLNDFIINTNILNQISYRLVDTDLKNDRTSVYYNKVIIGSRIPPLVLSGKIFLGTILSPFFSILALFFMLFFEKKYLNSDDIFLKYAWLFIAIRFAFNLGLSTGVLFGLFATFFLPLWATVKLNQSINKKQIKWR